MAARSLTSTPATCHRRRATTGRPRRVRLLAVALAAAAVTASAACGSGTGAASGPTEVEFFQFKGEAVQTFDKLIAKFNAENPDIHVTQNPSPDGEIGLRVRLVKNKVPDVMSLNVNGSYGEFSTAGIFHDFSKDPVVDTVTPGSVKILTDLGRGGADEVNGVPFAMNADGVIYNKAIFEKYDLSPPTSWDELITVCETLKANGVTPFYGTLKDAWTSLPSWNGLAGPMTPQDFWPRRAALETSFSEQWPEVMARHEQLFSYAQKDKFSKEYDAGNKAFAEGEAAMLLQGSWALAVINEFKPKFEVGTFPYPTGTSDADTRVTSGVDVALTVGKDGARHAESMKFIEFLMRPENVATYIKDQTAVPTLKGAKPSEPALAGLVPYYEQDKVVGFTDHRVPAGIGLDALLQQFLINGNDQAFLKTLDNEWNKVAERQGVAGAETK